MCTDASAPSARSCVSSAAGATCRAARSAWLDGRRIVLDALLARLDGHVVLRTRTAGDNARDVGETAARDLLDGKGGRALLEGASREMTVYLVGAGPGIRGC